MRETAPAACGREPANAGNCPELRARASYRAHRRYRSPSPSSVPGVGGAAHAPEGELGRGKDCTSLTLCVTSIDIDVTIRYCRPWSAGRSAGQ